MHRLILESRPELAWLFTDAHLPFSQRRESTAVPLFDRVNLGEDLLKGVYLR